VLHTTPPTEPEKVDTVRFWGSVLLAVGLVLCVGALFWAGGKPSWQVLGVFALVVLVGLGLRIEGAMRQR
jgi:ABC-type polysaccharide/polyol phosphate export permease